MAAAAFSRPAGISQALETIAGGDFNPVQTQWNQFWGTIAVHFKKVLATPDGIANVLQGDDLFLCALRKVGLHHTGGRS